MLSKLFVCGLAALALASGFATSASAQDPGCQREVIVQTGKPKLTFRGERAKKGEGPAARDAIMAWELRVAQRYGSRYAQWENARLIALYPGHEATKDKGWFDCTRG